MDCCVASFIMLRSSCGLPTVTGPTCNNKVVGLTSKVAINMKIAGQGHKMPSSTLPGRMKGYDYIGIETTNVSDHYKIQCKGQLFFCFWKGKTQVYSSLKFHNISKIVACRSTIRPLGSYSSKVTRGQTTGGTDRWNDWRVGWEDLDWCSR